MFGAFVTATFGRSAETSGTWGIRLYPNGLEKSPTTTCYIRPNLTIICFLCSMPVAGCQDLSKPYFKCLGQLGLLSWRLFSFGYHHGSFCSNRRTSWLPARSRGTSRTRAISFPTKLLHLQVLALCRTRLRQLSSRRKWPRPTMT